ncbi:MAG TPA: hypothetical protein VK151_01110 [Fluviicola sp.]|nr:hypothetical protein [Fluviicola sp.]
MSNNPIATKIMVIRHAEKPYGDYEGVTPKGKDDKEALIVQGWQRAGALAVLFSPFNKALQNPNLATPQFLYASGPGAESKSKRPVETITPLSELIRVNINESFGAKDYADMVASAQQQKGTVLIAWQHQDIPEIANIILGNESAPQKWPGDRFDLVWVFDLNASTGQYTLTQVPQNLLAGDLNTPIS